MPVLQLPHCLAGIVHIRCHAHREAGLLAAQREPVADSIERQFGCPRSKKCGVLAAMALSARGAVASCTRQVQLAPRGLGPADTMSLTATCQRPYSALSGVSILPSATCGSGLLTAAASESMTEANMSQLPCRLPLYRICSGFKRPVNKLACLAPWRSSGLCRASRRTSRLARLVWSAVWYRQPGDLGAVGRKIIASRVQRGIDLADQAFDSDCGAGGSASFLVGCSRGRPRDHS